MKGYTKQEQFWRSQFGKDYTKRNQLNPADKDALYIKTWGTSRSKMNELFLGGKKIESILEVGCNSADQLAILQKQGYDTLYGIEVQDDAVRIAKRLTDGINIIKGSAFDIPFKDEYFDLVFTSGVLIHIRPDDLPAVMREMYRVSRRYIWGYESYNATLIPLDYRGNADTLWKGDYAKLYTEQFPDLELMKQINYKFLANENVESMFILHKKNA